MDGIIVNGQNFSGQSSFSGVAGQTSGQTLANLDTGTRTSLAQIPQAYVDAIYSTIPGSAVCCLAGRLSCAVRREHQRQLCVWVSPLLNLVSE